MESLENMTPNEYAEELFRTHPSDRDYLNLSDRVQLTTTAQLLHGAIGLGGEAGELLDAVKKHIMYGKPIDRENILEECGDSLWYIIRTLKSQGYTLEDALIYNREKLKIRYPEKFTEKDAVERKDKIDYLSDKHRCPSCGSLDHTICGGEF